MLDLPFLPIHKERYDLVFMRDELKRPAVRELLLFINSSEFRTLSGQLGGYDCTVTGRLMVA